MQRKFSFSIDEYYHLYNRGNDKRLIYLEQRDYIRFQCLLFLCNGSVSVNISESFPKGIFFQDIVGIDRNETLVDVGAYCLMPNHFHLLVREKKENGISQFMRKTATAYSMYFNAKYERTGKLFEGAFKARHIDDDVYLKYLFSYIHLNPVKLIDKKWKVNRIQEKECARKYLENYSHSSYLDYRGKGRSEESILNRRAFPDYFDQPKEFNDFLDDWLVPIEKGESFLSLLKE